MTPNSADKARIRKRDGIRSLFYYYDGALYWKVSKTNGVKIGDLAGTVRDDGRRQIGINGKKYKAHRLIFLYHHGYLPEFLDHIDGNPANNNIANLREATLSQNQWNRKSVESYNGEPTSSGFKGVVLHRRRQKWQARIQINGERKYLGSFDSEIGAAEAYNDAATGLHGEFVEINKGEVNK